MYKVVQLNFAVHMALFKRSQLCFCATFRGAFVPARCLRSVPGSLLLPRRPLPHLPPSWQWRTTRTPPITAISSPPPTTNCNESGRTISCTRYIGRNSQLQNIFLKDSTHNSNLSVCGANPVMIGVNACTVIAHSKRCDS